MTSLARIYFILILITIRKLRIIESANKCQTCVNNDEETCQQRQSEIECTTEGARNVLKGLSAIFKSISKSNENKNFDCFIIDILMLGDTEDEHFIERIKNCIPSDIDACKLQIIPGLGLLHHSCMQCSGDNCNLNYTHIHSNAHSAHKLGNPFLPRKQRENLSDKKTVSGIDTYSIIFILIVLTAIFVCFIAWAIADKVC